MSPRMQPRNDKFFTLRSKSAWRFKAHHHDALGNHLRIDELAHRRTASGHRKQLSERG